MWTFIQTTIYDPIAHFFCGLINYMKDSPEDSVTIYTKMPTKLSVCLPRSVSYVDSRKNRSKPMNVNPSLMREDFFIY